MAMYAVRGVYFDRERAGQLVAIFACVTVAGGCSTDGRRLCVVVLFQERAEIKTAQINA